MISIDSGYSTCLEFNESVNSDRIKVFTLVSMTINVAFNTQSDSWYFDQSSDNTTINKHGWILWFKLYSSIQNMYIEWSDERNGYAKMESFYVDYD